MRALFAILIASAALAMPAVAQQQKPAGKAAAQQQEQKQAEPKGLAKLHPIDQRFFQYMAEGGLAEVEFGKLAQQKASNGEIKDFGRRMAEDHGRTHAKLDKWADSKGVPMPTKIGDQHQRLHAQLQAATGTEFDRIYVINQVDEHQRTMRVLEEHIRIGKDGKLRAFAGETLPLVKYHLSLIQDMYGQVLTSQASQQKQEPAPAQPKQSKARK